MAHSVRQQRRAYWHEVVADWARSGLSKAAYAREHGLAAHQLSQWAARYPEWVSAAEPVHAGDDRGAATAPGFVTIAAAPAGGDAPGEAIVVDLGNGWRLEVGPGFCSDTLQRVVAVLAS
jgi:hypothetical protein